jgi:pyruvate,water dikinase
MLDEDVIRLAKIGRKIELHYGKPMDIEWAIDKDLMAPGNVLILQSRPETVWSQRKSSPVIGPKSGFDLLMERAMRPFKVE